jgi:hypothetical protein
MISASLRMDSGDVATFFPVLAKKLQDALGDRVKVTRAKGLLHKKDQPIQGIELDARDTSLRAVFEKGRLNCTAAHVVRGMVLKTDTVDLDEWLTRVAVALKEEAAHSAITRAALERLLT